MAKRRDHEAALRKLLRGNPGTFDRWLQLQQLILLPNHTYTSDREDTLVAFSLMEDSAKLLLLQGMSLMTDDGPGKPLLVKGENLFQQGTAADGILSSMYSRLVLAETLGLIGPNTRQAIQTITLIRNVFAHSSHPIAYSNSDIMALIAMDIPKFFKHGLEIKIGEAYIFKFSLDTTRSSLLSFILHFSLFCHEGPSAEKDWRRAELFD